MSLRVPALAKKSRSRRDSSPVFLSRKQAPCSRSECFDGCRVEDQAVAQARSGLCPVAVSQEKRRVASNLGEVGENSGRLQKQPNRPIPRGAGSRQYAAKTFDRYHP